MAARGAALTALLTLGSLSIGCAGRETPRPPDATPALPASSSACDAGKAQFAAGQRFNTALVERARTAAQARSARVIRPDDMVTMEFLDSRLNLYLDEKDIVQSVRCG